MKIFIMLVLIISFYNGVSAKTYYSEYKDFSNEVEVEDSDNEYQQKYEDILKKYNLCESNHAILENKLEKTIEINKQSLLSVLFVFSILGLIIVSLWRIRSMKKLN